MQGVTGSSSVTRIFVRVLKITMFKNYIFWFFLFAFFPFRGQCSYPLYLENEIHSALLSRDAYYRSEGVAQLLFPFSAEDTTRLDSLRLKISEDISDRTPGVATPWPHLLAGLAVSKSSPQSMNEHFEHALGAASSDPGSTWVLAMEYGRFGLPQWERMCLDQLTKIIVLRGATVSIACAQPLLYKAIAADRNGQHSIAGDYYLLSQTFDRNNAWPIVRNIISNVPRHLSTVFDESEKLVVFLSHSWMAQLSLSLPLLLWIRLCMAFLVTIACLILGFKYSPSVLHWVIELFPRSVPRKWKNYFSAIIFISCISLGVLPFLWLVAFLTWRFCTRRDKWIMGVCCFLLMLYPLSIRFEDMFRQCLSPEGSISLFRKAIDEGYYPDLDRAVRAAAQSRGDDYLAQTAAALVALKGDDLAAAQLFIRNALALNKEDPAVLLTEGIILYRSGHYEKARSVYETCQQLHPGYVAAYFNSGQCYLVSNETIKGMEYLDRATKIDATAVNSFIAVNDELFVKKWPKLRQFMQPDYSPSYFWTKVFPCHWGSWATSNRLWGQSFLGMPLVGYCVSAPLLFMILLLLDFFKWSTPGVAKIFRCKLCDAAMCRKCKKGVICESCFGKLNQIRNENIRQRIIERILLKNRRTRRIGASLIDVLFPGSGMLYLSSGLPVVAGLIMAITASCYAFLLVFHAIPFAYPYWTVKDVMTCAYLTIPLYNAVFAIRAARTIFKEFRN
jgi:tetratricopeptide (TPR) repeat protein